MNPYYHAQHYDPGAFLAADSTALPPSAGALRLPEHLQWMPPGTSTIQATSNGRPARLTVHVNAETARVVQAAFEEMNRECERGVGDKPYFDLNHNDEEASAWPVAFTWGGDDPVTGGVRAKVTWSEAGKRALLGRNYRRFSPTFHLDGAGRVTGLPVNCGGLVNRAAFSKIQPVLAKADGTAAAPIAEAPEMLVMARLLEASDGIEFADAAARVAASDAAVYARYRSDLGLGPHRALDSTPQPAREIDAPFYVAAKVAGADRSLDSAEGAALVAHEAPEAYEEYRAALGLGGHRAPVTARAPETPAPDFMIAAKAIALHLRVEVEDAVIVLARENPGAYDAYRASLFNRVELMPEGGGTEPVLMAAHTVAARRNVGLGEAGAIVAREQPQLFARFRAAE